MNWGLFGQLIVGAVIVLVCVGATWEAYAEWSALHKERQRERAVRAARARVESQRAVERQRRLLAIADIVTAAPEHEKQRLQREAEALGFLDQDPPRMVS